MRKLATIRKIDDIQPIPKADAIECATIDGWQIVIKKGEFEVGDLCVFFEIDSMLPVEERYAFLKKTTKTLEGDGYRLKTIKLRGQISQGLALPLEKFPELKSPKLHKDVTKDLNVWKYEKTLQNGKATFRRLTKGLKGFIWKYFPKTAKRLTQKERTKSFPVFLRKTDQERIQNLKQYFNDVDSEWEVTLKLDGSSMTVWDYEDVSPKRRTFLQRIFPQPTQGVCSRNQNLPKDSSSFWNTAINEGLLEIIKGKNVALQGELIGPGIQKNHERVHTYEFRLFDIYDIKQQRYLLPRERMAWLMENDSNNKIKLCPIVEERVKIFEKCRDIDSLQKYVTGPSMNKDVISEGRVFKNLRSNRTFKCISNRYLLKCEE